MRATGHVGYPPGMTRSFFAAFLIALCAALSSPAHAWGALGHRLVARLAESDLSPKARAEVARLLRGETDPTLAGVANWADDLRDEPGFGRTTSRWHYVNIPEQHCRYDARRDCADGKCIVDAIQRQRAILADRSQPDEARARALKFLVHFVGDIHQPLHTIAAGRGGNDIQINLDGKGSNLHSLWDRELLASAKLDEAAYLKRLRHLPAPRAPVVGDAVTWAEASCKASTREGFMPPRAKIGQDYVQRWRPVAEAQLRQAGRALATLLNDTLK
jgi:hypothetical protein